MRHFSLAVFALALLAPAASLAQSDRAKPPATAPATAPAASAPAGSAGAGREQDAGPIDFMHVLARRGLHDIAEEWLSAYGQISLIGSGKPAFHAPYTNLNGSNHSLLPDAEGSFTGSATLFIGGRLWHGAEAYMVPEIISERPFSGLAGLGSTIQNAELQKTGGPAPTLYLARVFVRQTIGLGGARVEKTSAPMQLGGHTDSRRIVLTVGKFSALDILDKNAFAGDIRRQFLNMAFMTHAAWDFAADARGYTWGGVAEVYFDAWALRFGRLAVPLHPNQLALDVRVWDYFGDQIELEHDHTLFGQAGAVRVVAYRNHQNMGRFDDAVSARKADPSRNAASCGALFNYGSTNASAPDLCWVRRPNDKMGIGVNVEQHLRDDLGVFFRGMYSDGQSEVYAFTATDSSLSFGVLSGGSLWHRPDDSAGAAFGMGWISNQHAAYLAQGGIDGFIGDGKIAQAPESVFEVFYSVNLVKPLWLTADYQHISNPAYNADRGPVDVFSGRLHAEF